MELKGITVICGHYGTGKTNLSLNLALMSARSGHKTALVDLDVVNPYFRSSDYAETLARQGVEVIAPVYAGSTLDIPALSPRIDAALSGQYDRVLIDAGGDDVGATALGRYFGKIDRAGYDMLYVINMYRKMTDTPEKAAAILREIECASRLRASGIVNNSHLGGFTDAAALLDSAKYADDTAAVTGLPLVFTSAERRVLDACGDKIKNPLCIEIYVRPPWANK